MFNIDMLTVLDHEAFCQLASRKQIIALDILECAACPVLFSLLASCLVDVSCVLPANLMCKIIPLVYCCIIQECNRFQKKSGLDC